ncbi:hypothetical protein F0562_024638 [Nyssa sinensis]|uniref:Cyclin N-terminal domain-containing protein n=1 Tax=Nyssa sinensis TaxID=561372 RepID=A0A5J5BBD9_9ASTE|nr:hypothetical protein F0562_024638 [Nyssa sinensis]
MKKENLVIANVGQPTARITRARAAVCSASRGMPPSEAPKQQARKRVLQTNSKRAALDETNTSASVTAYVQHKRRAVLKDVTNVCCENSYRNCLNAAKIPKKNSTQTKKGSVNVSKVVPLLLQLRSSLPADSKTNMVQETGKTELQSSVALQQLPDDSKTSMALETGKTELQSVEVVCLVKLESNAPLQLSKESNAEKCGKYNSQLGKHYAGIPSQIYDFSKKEDVDLYGTLMIATVPDFTDIDSDHKDPQLCCLYAPDIYSNLHVAELIRRPSSNFMEIIQRDITQSLLRNISWCQTHCTSQCILIDFFLSQNYIARQRLQLLGITCMLIASKYEEICAPHVEEFCFITDNTYTRGEVLAMESQVLNYLGFQLSAPTAKTFLRRFLRAAQASYKTPSLELEFLADYLAELTLSSHPWNPTLEHYTNYKPSDLKTTVLALQDLQLNTSGCPLNAIRAKYRQDKFKCVAALSSPELLQTLFRT